MTDHRTERISEALREELAEMIGYELSDPRIGSATVTDVHVTPDKRHAFVRIGVAADADAEQTLAALEHAKNFLRRELSATPGAFSRPRFAFRSRRRHRARRPHGAFAQAHPKRPPTGINFFAIIP